MTNKNYVFESFNSFLSHQYNINEDKKVTLELKDILEFMDAIIEKQKELDKDNKRVNNTFGKYEDPKEGYDAYIKDKADKAGISEEKYKFIQGKEVKRRNQDGVRYAVALWPTLDKVIKKELAKKLLAEVLKKGYHNIDELIDLVEDKVFASSRPYIGALSEEVEIPDRPKPTMPVAETIIGEKDQLNVFKDNKWAYDDSSFEDEGVKDRIVSSIRDLLASEVAGDINIKSIKIVTSTSRFRNLPDGKGSDNKLSWGELSFKRAVTLSDIIKQVAEAQLFDTNMLNKLNSKIIINYAGDNGDGTSGPNPPEDFKFGYYDDKQEFIDGNTRNKVDVWALDKVGEPTSEMKILDIEPLDNKEDYDEFKYINILFEYDISEENKIPFNITDNGKENITLFSAISGVNKTNTRKTYSTKIRDKYKNKKNGNNDCPKWN